MPTAQQLPAEEQVTHASSFTAIAPVPPGCDMAVRAQVRPLQCSSWLRTLSWLDGPKAPTAQQEFRAPQPRPNRVASLWAVPLPGLGPCCTVQDLPAQLSA